MDNYPFDRQRCTVVFMSDSYNKDEIDLVPIYEEGANLLSLTNTGNDSQGYKLGEYMQVN